MPHPEWAACPRSDDSPLQIGFYDLPATGDQLIDPPLADAECRHDVVDGFVLVQHVINGHQARVLGGHLPAGVLDRHLEQDGSGSGICGGGVDALVRQLVPADFLVLPVLRLVAIRAFFALVPLVAPDESAALAADEASGFPDAVPVLGAEAVHHKIVERLVYGRQLDGDPLSPNTPCPAVGVIGLESPGTVLFDSSLAQTHRGRFCLASFL